MEEAAAVRRAASDATADVVPGELRETIDDYVATGSVVPGVLTLLSARTVAGTDPEDLAEQAAGVQLIYDGLRLTRDIAQQNPWLETADFDADGEDPGDPEGDANGDSIADSLRVDGRDDADMAILAADVLVARGFYLLARTDAAEDAVAVVRAFGRTQTERETESSNHATDFDRALETDVLELAVTTGVTAVGGTPDDAAVLAADFTPDGPRFAPAETFFDDRRRDRLASLTVDGGRPLNRND